MLRSEIISNLFEEFDTICRLCLCRSKKLKSIFELQYDKILVDVAKIQVEPDDQLPKKICVRCSDKIKDIISFISQCSTCEETLKEIEMEYRWKHGNFQDEMEDFVVSEEIDIKECTIVKSEEMCEPFEINTEAGSSNDFDNTISTSKELEGSVVIPGSPDSSYVLDDKITKEPVKETRMVCVNCGEIISCLKVHYKLEPKCKPRVLKCDICQFETSKKLELQLHKQEHLKTVTDKEKKQKEDGQSDLDVDFIESVESVPNFVPGEIMKKYVKKTGKICQSSSEISNLLTVPYQPAPKSTSKTLKCEICQFETSKKLELQLHKQEHLKAVTDKEKKQREDKQDFIESVCMTDVESVPNFVPDEIMKKYVKKTGNICQSSGEISNSLTVPYQPAPKSTPKTLKCETCQFETSKKLELQLHKQEHLKTAADTEKKQKENEESDVDEDFIESDYITDVDSVPTSVPHEIMEKSVKKTGKTCQSGDEIVNSLAVHCEPEPKCKTKTLKCEICQFETSKILEMQLHKHEDSTTVTDKEKQKSDADEDSLESVNIPSNADSVSPPPDETMKKSVKKSRKICQSCGEIVNSLTFHYQLEPKCKPKPLKCEVCQFETSKRLEMKLHKQEHPKTSTDKEQKQKKKPKQGRTCPSCSETGLILRDHWKENPYCVPKKHKCQHCEYKTASRKKFNTHQRVHLEKGSYEMFICHICSKEFKYETNLKRHLAVHENPKRFVCEYCGIGKSTNFELTEHINKHFDKREFLCDHCGASFHSKLVLTVHKSKHEIKECGKRTAGGSKIYKSFQCNLCERWLLGKPSLKYHMSFQHGVEQKDKYTCHKCPEEFTTLVQLKAHVTTVHWKKHFCSFCGKTFQNATVLEVHIRSHTGERPFSCAQCMQKFRQKEHLKTHLKSVHNGGAKAECHICKGIFTTKWNLLIHMRQHTGERPYECHICTKRFYAANNRKAHVRRAHGEKEVSKITQFLGQGPVPDYSLDT